MIVFIYLLYLQYCNYFFKQSHEQKGNWNCFWEIQQIYEQSFINQAIFKYMKPISDKDLIEEVRQRKEKLRSNLKIKVKSSFQKLQQKSEELEENKEIEHKRKFSNLAEVRCSKDKVIEEDFEYYFQKVDKIGEGAHSVVYSCQNRSSLQKFAVKVTRKKDLEHFQDIRESFLILKKLQHENIVRPDYLFMNQNLMTCHLVCQLCQYPDLKEYYLKNRPLPESQVAFILQEIIRTLQYIHSRGACHRDIKPDNILYDPKLKKIKIVDFQLSKMTKYLHEPLQLMTKAGPLNYRAPETFLGQIYDQQVDIWATGVMAYQLLTGKSPFPSKYEAKKINQICYEEPDYQIVPEQARDFIRQMLMKSPSERISAHEALHSKFFLVHSESPHSLHKTSNYSKSLNQLVIDSHYTRQHKKSYDTDCTEEFQGDLEGEANVLRCSKRTP